MVKLSEAQQAAKDAEQNRRQRIIDAGGDPDAPESQPGAAGAPQQPAEPEAAPPHPGSWVALTDSQTGTMTLVDAMAVTHVNPGHGSRPNRDPKKQATNGNEMGAVTEIGTVGGLVIRVLEDVAQVAALIGIRL